MASYQVYWGLATQVVPDSEVLTTAARSEHLARSNGCCWNLRALRRSSSKRRERSQPQRAETKGLKVSMHFLEREALISVATLFHPGYETTPASLLVCTGWHRQRKHQRVLVLIRAVQWSSSPNAHPGIQTARRGSPRQTGRYNHARMAQATQRLAALQVARLPSIHLRNLSYTYAQWGRHVSAM